MRRAALIVLLTATSVLGFNGVALAKSLNIYNWKNYYDPGLIEEFERDTGIDVQLTEFTKIEQLERAFEEHADYDLLAPSHFQLPALIAENRIEKLDVSRLSNYPEIDNSLLAALAAFGGANDYAVPYLWTAVGIAYDPETVKQLVDQEIPNSWSLVFYNDFLKQVSRCGVSWIEAPVEVFSLKTNFAGGQLNHSSERRLEKYSDELKESVRYVREINNQGYIEGLATGKLCVSIAWAGHALDARQTRKTVNFMLPDEGGLLTIDSWVIMKDSPNEDAAYQFIDYMLKRESGRRNATATNFFSHLPPSTASYNDKGLNPADVLGPNYRHKLYFIENLDRDRTQLIESHWRSIKSYL